MKRLLLTLCTLLYSIYSVAQVLPTIQQPVIPTPTTTLYLDFNNGNDNNNGLTQTSPLKTFGKAVSLCPYGVGNNGQAYSEVVILPGVYMLSEQVKQGHASYYKFSEVSPGVYDTMYRNISLRGIGEVILDGTNLSAAIASNSGAIVELLGSGISAKNLTIRNSSYNGIKFNDSTKLWVDDRYGGVRFAVPYHDILAENLTIYNCAYFAVHFMKGRTIRATGCHIYNTCLVNENRAVQIGGTATWPSALKSQHSLNVTFDNNNVHENWGEGINFNKSRNCLGYNNTSWDNFSVNFYMDHSSNTILRNNLLYNTGTSNTFWVADQEGATYNYKSAAMNLQIGGEYYGDFRGFQNSKNNYIYNNILIGGNLSFGGTHNSSYLLTHENVWVTNNFISGFYADPNAVKRVVNFADATVGGYTSQPTEYINVNFYNNIITLDPAKLNNYTREICRTTSVPLPTGLSFGNNYWSTNPSSSGHTYTLYNSATDVVNTALPHAISFSNLNAIKPANDASLRLSKPAVSFVAQDYDGLNRNTPNSNVGPYEYNASLPLRIEKFEAVKQGNKAAIRWTIGNHSANDRYFVLRSNNMLQWDTLGYYNASIVNPRQLQFEHIDTNPIKGNNYYRIMQKELNGAIYMTTIKRLVFEDPITFDVIKLRNGAYLITGKNIDLYNLSIFTASGQLIQTKKLVASNNLVTIRGLSSGLLYFTFRSKSGLVSTCTVAVTN